MKYLRFLLMISFMSTVLVGCTNKSTDSDNSSKETSEKVSSSSVSETTISISQESSSTSVEVPEATTNSSEQQIVPMGLSEEAILNSDYASLNGTWTNSHGYQLTFNNGTVTLSGEGTGGRTEFSLSDPQKQSNVIFLSFDPAPLPNGMNLMIALKGTSPTEGLDADGTDSNYDRIIMGNNGGTMLFALKENGGIPDTAYYREK
ncbi:hypothetical protein JZO81_05400 [Enterococcus hulanensis]|nr:DUF6287 domain-containing protein [Enterococcus hulanensis]MBO0410479.1 hypothetical protein [Enterococcus hulanensis]